LYFRGQGRGKYLFLGLPVRACLSFWYRYVCEKVKRREVKKVKAYEVDFVTSRGKESNWSFTLYDRDTLKRNFDVKIIMEGDVKQVVQHGIWVPTQHLLLAEENH
jgi:hypothetical protein